jgi:hypothetical protein
MVQVLQLQDLVREHADLIKGYYLEYAQGADMLEVTPLIDIFVHTAGVSPLVADLLRSIQAVCSLTGSAPPTYRTYLTFVYLFKPYKS